MTASPPWQIDNVEPEAREAAKLAARRAGLDIGAWLTNTIMASATAELKRATPAARGADAAHANHAPNGAANGQQGGDGARLPALPVEVLIDNIRRLTARIESTEQRTAEVIAPLASKMGSLSERIEEVSTRTNAATAPMERALSRMAERLERLENGGSNQKIGRAEAAYTPAKPRRRLFGLT
ncbi:MAG: hypothetical protein ACKVSF_06245 [Alphaproteobacteria bacterium]